MITNQNIIDSEAESTLKLQTNKNTTSRFVAFLDIMGFKDRVARTSHQELFAQLTDFNRDITICFRKYPQTEIQLAQFSDSILLFSKDTTLESLKYLADATRDIMRTAITQSVPIPLKGAIAQGEMTCDLQKQLFFGQALIDAYLLEENINYYGIIVHHTAEKSVLELVKTGDNIIFNDIKAPLKSGKITHYELSWYIDDMATDELAIKAIKESLTNFRQNVSDTPRKYIDNTLDVIRDYYIQKRRY